MDIKKMKPIDPFKFPSMPSLYSTHGGGELWRWGDYLVTFQKAPVSYYESIYINQGIKCPQIPPIKYLYSMQVYYAGKQSFIPGPPILALSLEQYDQSEQSSYVTPLLDGKNSPIILGLFTHDRHYALSEYKGGLDRNEICLAFLGILNAFLKLDSQPIKADQNELINIIKSIDNYKQSNTEKNLDEKFNIENDEKQIKSNNTLKKFIKKYCILILLLLIITSTFLILHTHKRSFFITDIENNIIYVNIDSDIVRIPYPTDFTKIKGKKFIDIEYHQVWGLTGRPNEINDESAYEILNLVHDNIYCRIGFICNSKDGQIIKSSFSSFNHYKDLIEQFAHIKKIPLYKNEKKVILDKGDNFIAVTTIYSESGIKEQRIVIETVIAMYIDEYVIETSFLLGTELANLENQTDEYAKVVKNYIKSFDDIKVMDNAEILIEIKESLRSIRD